MLTRKRSFMTILLIAATATTSFVAVADATDGIPV
jgi:hypothetical protein